MKCAFHNGYTNVAVVVLFSCWSYCLGNVIFVFVQIETPIGGSSRLSYRLKRLYDVSWITLHLQPHHKEHHHHTYQHLASVASNMARLLHHARFDINLRFFYYADDCQLCIRACNESLILSFNIQKCEFCAQI